MRQRKRLEMRLSGTSRLTSRDVGKFVGGTVIVTFALVVPYGAFNSTEARFSRLTAGLFVAPFVLLSVLFMRYLRRRDGVYKPRELAGLDEWGLAKAAERILLREGFWRVISETQEGRPRVFAWHPIGERLEIAVHTGPAPLRDTAPPWDAAPFSPGRTARLVIGIGAFTDEDARCAAGQGVHLLDGDHLKQWAREGYLHEQVTLWKSPPASRQVAEE
ncbi:hypothetical protein [Streptomyces sp. NBC_00199]|uniref:hypothetical protein n=1 Tax=Streptomyces sp. NBC_00199 TaxID=2975678 RepID=UPI00224FF902|nr:hypothetical protein [Streptomyces sp. NBC_00199]MCX5264881.1 hypothetical protein [Streptomyces sp. NBC_00199]